ncbi:hypothetical protein SAMD00019534_126620, partial [Acytostelium subglobosum LB1]|uniref:hypothetical protein n=1 Tax=Acytostelium subglobosum LB1 TaxID=1410327 RepID=UPI000644F05E
MTQKKKNIYSRHQQKDVGKVGCDGPCCDASPFDKKRKGPMTKRENGRHTSIIHDLHPNSSGASITVSINKDIYDTAATPTTTGGNSSCLCFDPVHHDYAKQHQLTNQHDPKRLEDFYQTFQFPVVHALDQHHPTMYHYGQDQCSAAPLTSMTMPTTPINNGISAMTPAQQSHVRLSTNNFYLSHIHQLYTNANHAHNGVKVLDSFTYPIISEFHFESITTLRHKFFATFLETTQPVFDIGTSFIIIPLFHNNHHSLALVGVKDASPQYILHIDSVSTSSHSSSPSAVAAGGSGGALDWEKIKQFIYIQHILDECRQKAIPLSKQSVDIKTSTKYLQVFSMVIPLCSNGSTYSLCDHTDCSNAVLAIAQMLFDTSLTRDVVVGANYNQPPIERINNQYNNNKAKYQLKDMASVVDRAISASNQDHNSMCSVIQKQELPAYFGRDLKANYSLGFPKNCYFEVTITVVPDTTTNTSSSQTLVYST